METPTCSKCGSTKIVPDARTYETAGGGVLATCVNANPKAIIFKETVSGYLKARICGDCGLAELYVDNAVELYQAHAASLRS
jgi:predicted nucleic-acid-binding Zn-ribbon protein